MADKQSSWVLVGAERLQADVVRKQDPIVKGETVVVESEQALDYVQNATFIDPRTNEERPMFLADTDISAKRASAIFRGEPLPVETMKPGARRRRTATTA